MASKSGRRDPVKEQFWSWSISALGEVWVEKSKPFTPANRGCASSGYRVSSLALPPQAAWPVVFPWV